MKKLTSLLLCIMLVMSVMPVAFAAEGDWTGTGTEGDPYVISDVAGLKKLADDVNGGTSYAGTYFKLGEDIDMTGNNFQIGAVSDSGNLIPNVGSAFSGIFDGNGHTITYTNSHDDYHVGAALFAAVKGTSESRAAIKNLTVRGSSKAYKWVSGIVAYAEYTDILNCTSYVNTYKAETWQCVGGIVSSAVNITIADCVNYGVHNNDTSSAVGGIAGYIDGETTVERCVNYGEIGANSSNVNQAGGIVGYAKGKHTISMCVNYANLCTNNNWDIGGIVGKAEGTSAGAIIKDCYSICNGGSAGIVGWLREKNETLENCYSMTTGWNKGPGIAGLTNDPTVTNCYAYDLNANDPYTANGVNALVKADDFKTLAASLDNGRGVWTQGDEYPVLVCFLDDDVEVETTATISGVDGATVTYAVTLADEDAIVIVALYNGNDLVAVKTNVEAGTDKTVTLDKAEGETVTNAKIFVWDSLANAKPITLGEYTIGD